MRKFIFACLLSVILGACNPVANLDSGEAKIEQWQAAYDGGNPARLYALAGDEFKEVSNEEEFADFLEVLYARLGRTVTTERINFNVNATPAGTVTVIVMQTEFEQGMGTETFTFRGGGEEFELVGWQVNSDRLMITAEDLAK